MSFDASLFLNLILIFTFYSSPKQVRSIMNLKLSVTLILFFTLLSATVCAVTRRLDPTDVLLVLNMENISLLPRNFRMSTNEMDDTVRPPSTIGLEKLKASGSGQFSQRSLEWMLNIIPSSSILIVDLREESHGFLNGHAMSWYANMNLGNLGKSVEEIHFDENMCLQDSLHMGGVYFYHNENPFPFLIGVNYACNEQMLAEFYGLHYMRLPCTDHRKPTDAVVDDFIALLRSRPHDQWLHFHCSAGKGRTSTFMTMLDIFLNAKEVSLEDIISRQKLIGGKDFWNLPSTDSWKYDSMVDRIDFLKEFYTYCQTASENQTWTQWVLDKN